jgi:hypothetical protein
MFQPFRSSRMVIAAIVACASSWRRTDRRIARASATSSSHEL